MKTTKELFEDGSMLIRDYKGYEQMLMNEGTFIAIVDETIEAVKNNIVLPDVIGRSELLFAFIAEVKKEFADQNWDYLDFIAERFLKANNSH